jgi:hypothetical protein
MDIFPKTHTVHELTGVILYSLGVFIALVFWSFALLWLSLLWPQYTTLGEYRLIWDGGGMFSLSMGA